MISYREKELLMAQKYLADHTIQVSDELSKIHNNFLNKSVAEANFDVLPEISEYDDILTAAREAGYDTSVRIEDLLTQEELDQLEKEYDEIENKFKDVTKLKKCDIEFIVGATLAQCIRQVLQPKVDFESFNLSERKGEKDTAKEAKKKQQEQVDKYKDTAKQDKTKGSKYYHADVDDIIKPTKAPYDAIRGGSKYGLKLCGLNHRYKTLGHDPWLGYVFGTANILTNTISLSKENNFQTFHVDIKGQYMEITEHADMLKMFNHCKTRFDESKSTVALAVIKQIYHINSDISSKEGLPLPFLELFLNEEMIKQLCDMGFDYKNVVGTIKTVSEQAGLAVLINFIVAIAHRIMMAYQENKEKGENKDTTIQAIKKYKIFNSEAKLAEVRTRKVLLFSNLIATSVNAGVVAGVSIAGTVTENPELVKNAVKYLDIGGYIVTLYRLFSDVRFITKMKKDFIAKALEEDFQKSLDEYNLN